MSKQVTIRIISNEPYPLGVFMTLALRDTTPGRTYQGTLYEQGEVDSEGDHCDQQGVLFKDDEGDTVFSFTSSGRWEVV